MTKKGGKGGGNVSKAKRKNAAVAAQINSDKLTSV